MGKREDNRHERRQHIVDTARQLMQARNASGFSMRTLAEVAGVSIATPYNLFGSKEAIVAAVMDADLDNFQAALAGRSSDPIEVFFAAITIARETFEREPGFYKAGAQAIQSDSTTELATHFGVPRHALLRNLVAEAIQQGCISHRVNADSLAATLGQQFFGWIQAWARDAVSLEDMELRTQYAFALSLAAVAAPDRQAPLLERLFTIQARLPEATWSGNTSTAPERAQPQEIHS